MGTGANLSIKQRAYPSEPYRISRGSYEDIPLPSPFPGATASRRVRTRQGPAPPRPAYRQQGDVFRRVWRAVCARDELWSTEELRPPRVAPMDWRRMLAVAADPQSSRRNLLWLFLKREELPPGVLPLLLRNPSLRLTDIKKAMQQGFGEIAQNPALPRLLRERPTMRYLVGGLLLREVGALASTCSAKLGRLALREWVFAVAFDMDVRGRPRRRDEEARRRRLHLPGGPCLGVEVDPLDWHWLDEEEASWRENVSDFVQGLAAMHWHPTGAAMALAARLRPLPRAWPGGSQAENDARLDRLDALLGHPRLVSEPPAPLSPGQLSLPLEPSS